MSSEHRLYVGSRFTGIAVVPDAKWPGMWRVRTPDGRLSDMVNLARAKDAGFARAHVGGEEVARWHHRQSGGARAPVAKSPEGVA